jgi:hypothetical protein
LPAPIAEIAFQNKTIVYAILFKAAADAMTALAAAVVDFEMFALTWTRRSLIPMARKAGVRHSIR